MDNGMKVSVAVCQVQVKASEVFSVSTYLYDISVINMNEASSSFLLLFHPVSQNKYMWNRTEHERQLRYTNPSPICSLKQSYLEKPRIDGQIHN